MFYISFIMHMYGSALFEKKNRSESEEFKTKSIGIEYMESKPFRSESVTCLYIVKAN